ncbi:hypothetical protein [Blastococcus sp. SYSU D01042]
MAISVHDVRGTTAWPGLVLPAAQGTARSRPPVAVVLAGLLAVVESIALLAVALNGLDGLLTGPSRPAAPVAALVLLGLAAWIVLAAGSGAMVVDGSSRGLLVGVAVGELFLVALLGLLAVVDPIAAPAGSSLPLLLLVAVAVPIGKLLLAGSPSTEAWLVAGPRPVEPRPDPATTHRALATATLGVIGLALGAVALLGPADEPLRTGETASTAVYQP